ncbi:MAG: CPBP family intramembrane metalloprotease [Chlorobaculum sp.]|nr:CPBP family intramembrane metalloprotease [Chlorobaculum sp.]
MNITRNKEYPGRPSLFGTILVLLSVLAAYPLVGAFLTILVTGGISLDDSFQSFTGPVVSKMLAAQAVGQILVLALPVFWIVSSFTGEGVFGKATLGWLGMGKRSGARTALMAGAGMLLLQPALYTIVELQMLLLPHLGAFGKSLMQQQATLDLFIRKLAGGSSFDSILLSFLVIVLTPALCEELFFRGYIQKSLALSLSPGKGVFITGAVFAMFHLEWFNLVPLALLGWYIGYIYWKSDNLLVSAVAHGTNNLAAFILLKSGLDSGSAGEASSGMLDSWQWWVLVVVSLFLFFQLIRSFPVRPTLLDADNPMPAGHR